MQEQLIVSVSGVRGTIGRTLTPEVGLAFGRAFATFLTRRQSDKRLRVAIGRDTRPSGTMMRGAVAAGLMSCGVDVVDLGMVTTPGAALMTRLLGCDGGIVITASHNPTPYNGIKFLQPTGVALPAEQAAELKDIWRNHEFHLVAGDRIGRETVNHETNTRHIEKVCEILDVERIRGGAYKVVLDSINGAGCEVTPKLLQKLGCEVIQLNGEPTGDFAHEPEPIEKNLLDLQEAVCLHGAHIGFAQDPDADRLVVVDETGRFIGEEYTLALTTAFTLRGRKGDLAANLATSRMIDDIADDAGVTVFRSPTGEANVVECMEKHNCIFGGEGNGGVIDPRVVSVRDSLTGMGLLLNYLAETAQPLSELADAIPTYHLKKTKLPCPAEKVPTILAKAQAAFADRPDATCNTEDGLRIDLPDSWASIRGSNTEPIIRVFAEAPDAERARALAAEMQAIAEEVIRE